MKSASTVLAFSVSPNVPSSNIGWPRLDLLRLLIRARLKSWVDGRFLGFWWWLLEPTAMTATYLAMVELAFPSGRPQPALFLMCAILPWTWFIAATGEGGRSLVQNGNVLKSAAVPYVLFPTAEVTASTVRYLFSLVLLALLMVYYGLTPTPWLACLPLLMAVQYVLALGISYWLSCAQVYIEDTSHAWQIVCRVWFFLSPSIYGIDQIPARFHTLYLLNPFAALFTSYRNILIHGSAPEWPYLATALGGAALICVSGHFLLRRSQGTVPLHL